MNVPFVDPARGYAAVAAAADERILAVARSGRYILGPQAAALEAEVASYVGADHAIACNSGTDALRLALAALGIGPGAEVVTTPFTFAATVEAIEHVGATPVLADIDPRTLDLDPRSATAAITARTRALLPVHLFGLPADMPALRHLAQAHGLRIVEDCAQALGGSLGGRSVGAIADAGALSFYPTKTLGGCGDGGMVTTNDDEVAHRVRLLRHHGSDDDGEHVVLGGNSRLDDVQAAVLRTKLPRLEAMIARRRDIAARYDAALTGTRATPPVQPEGAVHAFGCYTLLVDGRDRLRQQLDEAGVATATYYARPLHRHGHFAASCRFGPLPVTDDVASRCLSLPVFPELTDAEVDYVATTIRRLLA